MDIGAIIFGTFGVAIGLVALWIGLSVSRNAEKHDAEMAQLAQTGTVAPATIVKVWDTGSSMGSSPVIGMRLEVKPAGRPPFTVEIEQTVSRLQAGDFHDGDPATVKYDPADTSKVVVVTVPR